MVEHLFAEFRTAGDLVRGIETLERLGIRRMDAFTPYPVRDVERALDRRRSPLGYFVAAGGLAGATLAYLIQWYLNAVDYPLDVGGRPPHAWPAFVPITFEMGVLLAAFTAFFGAMARSRLRLSHVADVVSAFGRSSIDRFWLGVDGGDPMLEKSEATQVLEELGATEIVWISARGAGR